MKFRLLVLVVVMGVMSVPMLADSIELFDNGSVVGADLGLRDNFGTSSIYDDLNVISWRYDDPYVNTRWEN